MTSKSTFKLTLTALTIGVSLSASMSAFAQYNPNIQNNVGNGMMDNAALYNPTPYNPVAATGSGYTNDGTLFMGGQKIGNPHQILHDLNVPSFFGVNANRLSYSDNPSYGQGTLAQMENHTLTIGVPTANVVLSRLYVTPTNPYTQGVATPHNNYQTYQGVVADAQAGSYQLTVANDNKLYAFKTLGAMSTQSQNILIKELPAHSVFIANSDPKGGAVAVRVTQNGDYAAMQNYFDTVKPYDFSWRSALAPMANDPNTGAFVANWVMGSHQVQAYQAGLQNQSIQSGNEAFGVLAWDANQNKYVMLDPTNTQATAGSVSGNMPTLGNNQFGFFGMHTHAGNATLSGQDFAMTQQLGLDQMVIGTNGTQVILTNNASDNWQGAGFLFEGPIVSNPTYGNTINPANSNVRQGNGLYQSRTGGAHAGIDITSANGAPVMAVGSGTVVSTYESTTYGKQVIINHGNGIYSVNSHLDSVSVKVGDKVEAGQEVGTSGITGNTPPKAEPHLHFEIRVGSDKPEIAGGTTANPLNYLPGPYYQNGILVSPNYVSPYVTGPYYTPPTYGTSTQSTSTQSDPISSFLSGTGGSGD